MNDPRPYVRLFIDDFWGADLVETMTFEAVGLFLAMLCREWKSGSLPVDAAALQRLFGGRCSAWDETFAMVRPCFFERDGRLFNKRLEFEREEANATSTIQAKKAKAKWDKWRAANAAAVPQHNLGTAAAMPMSGTERNGMERKRASRDAAAPLDLSAHPTLETPAFRAAWDLWVQYRRERRLSAYKPTGLNGCLTELAVNGSERAIEAIKNSIAKNYQGIYEAKEPTNGYHGEPRNEPPKLVNGKTPERIKTEAWLAEQEKLKRQIAAERSGVDAPLRARFEVARDDF